ncbi:hypothetical protein Tco_0715960, partial [Tanacetum coccineum]
VHDSNDVLGYWLCNTSTLLTLTLLQQTLKASGVVHMQATFYNLCLIYVEEDSMRFKFWQMPLLGDQELVEDKRSELVEDKGERNCVGADVAVSSAVTTTFSLILVVKLVKKDGRNLVPFIRRHIQDNIIITQELLKGYKRKQGAKRCAMKIDIQKAYDTVSWEFLKEDLDSVLSSMQQYCASVHMILSPVFKDLDKLLKRFLWNAGDYAKGKARVAWSLGWKYMLELRDKIRPFVIHKMGDGKNTSLLYDKRCSSGPLINHIPKRAMFEATFKGNKIVRDGVINNKWDWPDDWTTLYPSLNQISTPTFRYCKDNVKWINAKNKEVDFSIQVAWLSLREMTVQGKLLTQDKIMVWQQRDDLKCTLCKSERLTSNSTYFNSLECGKGFRLKAVYAEVDTLCKILNERNKRMFQNFSRTEDDLAGCIENNVGDMLKCLKVKKSYAVLIVSNRWSLKWDKGN